ncbi:MAG: hypothetical protein PUG48_05350 [Clostridia bacterium]|nr:hypothetical protein [Clostridia bacterium]
MFISEKLTRFLKTSLSTYTDVSRPQRISAIYFTLSKTIWRNSTLIDVSSSPASISLLTDCIIKRFSYFSSKPSTVFSQKSEIASSIGIDESPARYKAASSWYSSFKSQMYGCGILFLTLLCEISKTYFILGYWPLSSIKAIPTSPLLIFLPNFLDQTSKVATAVAFGNCAEISI